MIILNFYANGFIFDGHDEEGEICDVISYAGSSCINDCSIYDEKLIYSQTEGNTHMKLNDCSSKSLDIYCLFRYNLCKWCVDVYGDKVVINNKFNEFLELEE